MFIHWCVIFSRAARMSYSQPGSTKNARSIALATIWFYAKCSAMWVMSLRNASSFMFYVWCHFAVFAPHPGLVGMIRQRLIIYEAVCCR